VNSIVINCSIEIKCFLVQPLVLTLPSVRVPFEASSRLLLHAFVTTQRWLGICWRLRQLGIFRRCGWHACEFAVAAHPGHEKHSKSER
jgi:hypothetical protein